MKFDLHTHHERCGHAIGRIEEYIQTAIDNGLNVLGISDHSPFFGNERDYPYPGLAMANSQFTEYISEVTLLKKKYHNRIEILLGMESDYFPGLVEMYSQVYQKYPFDYLIGSVHVSNGTHLAEYSWDGKSEAQQIKEKEIYYSLVQMAVKSKSFDILGHFDAMKGRFPQFDVIPTDLADKTLQMIAENDIVIEVNTSGSYKKCRSWFPSDELLERAFFHGVRVTFGSDAHQPVRVGDEFSSVRQRLREIGYREWAIFRQRQRYMVEI